MAPCPNVVLAARKRGITEVLHFTTNRGAVGILFSGAIKSRVLLTPDKYLEHVYSPNAPDRSRDSEWHGYVNLSVSRINDWMFDKSEEWHVTDEVSWVAFVFSEVILADPGVVFVTTNNAYPTCHRAEGRTGFEQMFADRVPWGYYGSVATRRGAADHHPTHRQAEVLYPGELSLDHLIRIDAQVETGLDDLNGALGALDCSYETRLAPEVFE
jgi:hypothetical protein